MRILRNVSIICLTSILLVGCASITGNEEWPVPLKPETKPVKVLPVTEADVKDNGFYMDREDANNLADNVDELKAYIEKLEVVIRQMKKHYGAK